jgi:predicted protein tyrosine phosphatase
MVTVASLTEANDLHVNFETVITAGPRPRDITWKHQHHLIRSFYDINNSQARGAPTVDDVAAMLSFGAARSSVLVHCHRGESRSVAVAIGLLVQAGASPSEATEQLKAQHVAGRSFIPNALVLTHVESVLGRPGLVAEVARQAPTSGVLLPLGTTRPW